MTARVDLCVEKHVPEKQRYDALSPNELDEFNQTVACEATSLGVPFQTITQGYGYSQSS